MELRVRDVAAILNESEDTIVRWARRGILPALCVQDQYLFNRVELQEWASLHAHRVAPELFAPDGAKDELPSLGAAVERGGVFYELPGNSRDQVLEAASQLPSIPPAVNRPLLYQLLVGREAMASTGLGQGIAIPHPRDPLVLRIDKPIVLLCFLAQPADFHAMDGKPVRVLFIVLTPAVRMHLQLLASLAFALHDDLLKRLLGEVAPREAILERLRTIERSSTVAAGGRPGA